MILVAYRHGFRASEVCDLDWSAIDFARAEMHVNRSKSGKPSTHPIRGDELRELRKLRRESKGSFVFMSERGGFTTIAAVSFLTIAATSSVVLAQQGPVAACRW